MPIKTVKELMIPLSEYAVVPENASLYEAVKALNKAQSLLKPSRQSARAVLVANDKNQIIGQIEQVDFLKALEPKYAMLGDLEAVSRAGLGDEMINAMIDNLKFWQADVDEACARAKMIPVKDIMEPINRSIDQGVSLAEAIHKFVIWQTRRLPVKSGHEIIGILRLTDVFKNVTDYMDELP